MKVRRIQSLQKQLHMRKVYKGRRKEKRENYVTLNETLENVCHLLAIGSHNCKTSGDNDPEKKNKP